jgi:hypothetical protein
MGKIMAGVQTQLPLMSSKNLYFTTRLAAGIVKTANYTSQLIETRVYDSANLFYLSGRPTYTTSKYYTTPLKWAFAYLAGLGLQYGLNKQFFLKGCVDYSSATPRFFRIYYYSDFGVKTFPRQPMNTVAICIGAGVNL